MRDAAISGEACPAGFSSFEQDAGVAEIPDVLRAEAYEALPAARRAWIKTTLALVGAVYGEYPGEQICRTARTGLGFADERRTRVADWVLCVPGAGFASAPRLAAAVMCARLAGLDAVLTIWPQADPAACSPDLLTALELSGADMSYTRAAPPARAHRGWARVVDAVRRAAGPSGRILYFGADDDDAAALAALAFARRIPLWRDAAPCAAVAPGYPGDPGVIRWAHPDARPAHDATRATVLYAAEPSPCAPPLRLGPGLEGCWLHPDLSPGFFLDSAFGLDTAS